MNNDLIRQLANATRGDFIKFQRVCSELEPAVRKCLEERGWAKESVQKFVEDCALRRLEHVEEVGPGTDRAAELESILHATIDRLARRWCSHCWVIMREQCPELYEFRCQHRDRHP